MQVRDHHDPVVERRCGLIVLAGVVVMAAAAILLFWSVEALFRLFR